jgi:hypothetical protein
MVTSGTCAQVDAPGDHRRLHLQRHRGGFVQHFRREFVRQVVAVDRGLDHQRRRELVAQHRQTLPIGGRRASGAW